MRALVIDRIDHTALIDVEPPKQGPGEVLIAVRHVGLCGSDLNTFKGLNPLVGLPRIPGHEISGEVVAGGGFAPGQRVTALPYTSCGTCPSCRRGRVNACRHNRTLGVQQDGALTETIVVAADKVVACDHLPARHLALVEPLSVGFHAVARGRVAAGDRVLVLGSGMIGVGAILGALRAGAEVTVSDPSPEKRRLALDFGAAHAVDPATLASEAAAITGGDGFDVVIEAVGVPETFVAAIEQASFAGRVVYIGYCKAPVTYQTAMFNLKELDIMGSRNATLADFQAVIAGLGQLGNAADRLVTRVFPFASAAEALPFWDAHRAETLKIMVER